MFLSAGLYGLSRRRDAQTAREAPAEAPTHEAADDPADTPALDEPSAPFELPLARFPGGVWATDRALRLTSAAGARMDDLLGDVAAGQPLVERLPEGARQAGLDAHQRALEGNSSTWEWRRGNRIYEVQVVPGEPGTVAVALDVTERRKREDARIADRLRQAQKLESLGVLAGGIAHDFNNLLVGILGNASMAVHETAPGSRVRPLVEGIEAAARRASDLTAQMLAYSGKGRFQIEPVDLSGLVLEMVELLDASISKRIRVEFDLAEDLPPVEADVTQLRQVAMNLITNAADAIEDEDGALVLSTRLEQASREDLASTWLDDDLPAGAYVVLEVADTGCGMDEATQARMFDPFFTRKSSGHGLGLAATLGVVRGHRGAIDVDSAPDYGTTVRVLLPAAEIREVAPEPVSRPPSAPRRGGTVLVVDDEDIVREFTAMALERAGLEVRTARDGVEAVELFGDIRDEVDVVLLDMTMPRMGGEEALRALKEIDPGVRVVLSSGYSEQDVGARLSGGGATSFLKKPYAASELITAIRDALQ